MDRGVTEPHDKTSYARQLIRTDHAGKDTRKLRNDLNYHEDQNTGRNHQNNDGIYHRSLYLALKSFGFLHEFGESRQHQFQNTTGLTCLDHIDVERNKYLRVLCEGLRKSAPPLY